MFKKTLIFLLVVVVLALAAFFIFSERSEPAPSPATGDDGDVTQPTNGLSPTSTVKTFYQEWIDFEGNPMVEDIHQDSELVTENLVSRIEKAKGFDPVLCAQDIPSDFEVKLAFSGASSSVVQVKEFFGGKPSTHEVKLIKKNKKWLINGVDCRPEINKQGSFSETGNLVKNLPGVEEKGWFLSYEREGGPGLAAKLEFNKESSCSFEGIDTKKSSCEKALSEDLIGTRVKVEGEKDGKKVTVSTLSEQ